MPIQNSGLDCVADSRTDARQRRRQIGAHQLSIKPQYPIPEAPKHPVSAHVSGDTAGMERPIDLNSQLDRRCQEVQDEPVNRHLTAEMQFQADCAKLRAIILAPSLFQIAAYSERAPQAAAGI